MTRVILDPSDPEKLSDRCDCDVKTAVSRGLAEYIAVAAVIRPSRGLAQVQLKKVVNMYAEPEVLSDYPSGSVTFAGDGQYDQSSLETIQVNESTCVVVLSSFTQDMVLEIWCTNPTERGLFSDAAEQALDPTDWMCGLRLELPHYYNVRATYMVKSVEFDDSEAQNMRRYRIARLTITCTAPRLRAVPMTPMDPRTVSEVATQQDPDLYQE